MASDTNNVEAINLLLESWAYINIQDNLGQTPLHNAAYNNNVDAILLLLKNGADTSINKDGKIPLDLAQPASFAANLIAKLSEISIQNITNQQMLYCFVKSLHKYYNSHFTVASYCDYTFEEGLEGDLLCCFINDEGYFTLNNTELRHLKKAILENKDAHDTEDLAYKEVLMTFKGYFDYFKNTNSSNRNVFFQGEESKKLSEEFCINILDCFIQIDVSTDRKFKDFLKEKYVKAEVASDIDLSSAISGISFSSCNQGAQKF